MKNKSFYRLMVIWMYYSEYYNVTCHCQLLNYLPKEGREEEGKTLVL